MVIVDWDKVKIGKISLCAPETKLFSGERVFELKVLYDGSDFLLEGPEGCPVRNLNNGGTSCSAM